MGTNFFLGEPYAILMVNTKGLKEVALMGKRKKALSNQNLPNSKITQEKAIKKLNIALKFADVALRAILIIGRIIGWFG